MVNDVLLSPSMKTPQIKKAEALLKVYTREPACVPPLLQQMRSSQHEQARQLAAMLLKKKIMLHWKTFNEQEKVLIIRTEEKNID